MRRPVALLVAAVTIAATLAVAGCGSTSSNAPSGGRVPRSFLGIVTEDAFARPGAYRERQFAAQHRAGIGVVRQTFSWKAIERTPGHYALGTYDRFVADAARAGLTILPILFDPPPFDALPLPVGPSPATPRPRGSEAMGRFAEALVRRYGPQGTLWRDQPDLPRHPIRSWQIWNEPNLPVYWGRRPDARQYVVLLRGVGHAIKRIDPAAKIVTAGLPESKLGTPFATYLKAMYAAGAQGTFDVLAINAYSSHVTGMKTAILGARRIMASAEDGDIPIWVTEFGWATQPGPGSAMTVKLRTQASLLGTAIWVLERDRKRLGLQGIVYYAWRDAAVYPGGKDFWGLHTGLLTRLGRAKPALRALGRGARPLVR